MAVIDIEIRYGGAGYGWFVMRRYSLTGGWRTISGPWTTKAQAEEQAEFERQRARFSVASGHSVKAPTLEEEGR